MKLSEYARKVGVHYHTAWRWFQTGRISGYQMETGTIIITEEDDTPLPQKVAIYARVSSHEMKDNLQRQADRLVDDCAAKGWQVHKVVKEIGSGTRFGFNYLGTLLSLQNRRIEVVNTSATLSTGLADNSKEDLLPDLVSIIYSFSARLYGKRRARRKTEKISQALKEDNGL
jgi:putative resolvase